MNSYSIRWLEKDTDKYIFPSSRKGFVIIHEPTKKEYKLQENPKGTGLQLEPVQCFNLCNNNYL